MSTPILTTKLYIPPTRPELVSRPRLIERLNEGRHRKLILISAPAGFGKTTLVSEWIADCKRPEPEIRVAWLSLDEGDNDLVYFLSYLTAALQTIVPTLGEDVVKALHSPQPPPHESILTSLLNDLATIPDDFALVLDDYHLIDTQSIDRALTFLLDHLPPQMHLVVTTREDPQLPLARLRARSQLTELRAADLRFTPAEAAEFLNQVMGLDLSSEEVAALEARTEGWIAGLQLAALSIQGREDTSGFIKAFAGDNHYIVDYLVEEVLQCQPDSVRSFLLQTSVLGRLSGPLCDAVTRREESGTLLETLERGNLFVVPLDDKRRWFRYHHLFADVLRAHLLEEQPDQVPVLHRRASEWYEQNDSPDDAVCHAFAAEDFERAAGLIELAWPSMDESFQTLTWLGWAKALPEELIQNRPVLSASYAWALMESGDLEAAGVHIQNAERWLDAVADGSEHSESPLAEMVVVDEAQFRSLPAVIASARTYHSQALGDVPHAISYGQRALDLLPEEEYLQRGNIAALLGVAYWGTGDLEKAYRTLAEGMENMRTAGNLPFALRGAYILADIRLAQGRLREAISTYERCLRLATEEGEQTLRGTADLYLRLSALYHEQNNPSAAAELIRKAEELGGQDASPHWPYTLCIAQARLKKAQGDLDGALDLLDEAERQYIPTPVPDVHPVAALKARVWASQGRLDEALDWARERGLSVKDDLSYLREFEHITLARVLIAQYRSDGAERAIREALGLLERLLEAAEAGGRNGSALEILLSQALAYEAQGDIPTALVPLERALTLAEPEGYVRLFVGEGPPMVRLLVEAAGRGVMADYAGRLLSVFDGESQIASPSSQPLIEPLSDRELEVLHLVAQGLSNREIAEQLYLALSTVKGHNRVIYGKLGVQRRTEAVVRARELGLL
jgi:LuxR family maltose regulon positive regulatory protein